MTHPPIAITAVGAICSLGNNVEAITKALLSGERGIGPARHVHTPFNDLVLGEVDASDRDLTERLPRTVETPPRSRTGLLAINAALEAAGHSANELRTAVISASTVGGMDLTERQYSHWSSGDLRTASIAREHPVGYHTRHVAKAIGSRAPYTTISTACSSSANAIIHGAQLLLSGRADRVLAGGADALCAFTMEGFRALSAMDPAATRPFSPDRSGMNLGEGAAYVILERTADAARAGRTILAYLGGWANRNDAFHQTATSPEGNGPYDAMRSAIAMAGLSPADIDHINAHGTGTGNNDDTELTAIERLFETVPPFTSTKALTGHTLAAAGALEAIIAIICMREGIIPVGHATTERMEGHRAQPVANTIHRPVQSVLSNSFGFGGNDTALLLLAAR